jgi:hypothetical protein
LSTCDWPDASGPDWARIPEELDEAIAEAHAAVVRWEYQHVDALLESPRPFASEQSGRSPVAPRPPGWKPRDLSNAVRYGWDVQDRLRVAQRFTTFADEVQPASEDILTFRFSEAGDHLDIFRMPYPDGSERLELRTVTRRRVDDRGRLCGLLTWFPEASQGLRWVRTRFEWDEQDRVVALAMERDAPSRPGARWEADLDADGQLIALSHRVLDADGTTVEQVLAWQRTEKDELRIAEQLLADELPKAIAAWFARVRPGDPIYCLAIVYGDTWGPSLGVGTVSERESWGPSGSPERKDMMWNPAEFACFDPEPDELNTEELTAAYRTTAQLWGFKSPERIRKTCLTATEAVSLDTSGQAVVVYCTDTELTDLDRNARKLRITPAMRAMERGTAGVQ